MKKLRSPSTSRKLLQGTKNVQVKQGEAHLHSLIEVERSRLNANEFLNIDAILEAVLHKIVLAPVKAHLYHLMVREHSKTGSLQNISENLSYLRSLSPEQLGFHSTTTMTPHVMDSIKACLRRMQHHYSPCRKLEHLLKAISLAMGHSENCLKNVPPADELVRWLVYLLAKSSTVGCEVEAWYMWELLPRQLLTTGDASYYLTALFSAVHVLKNPDCMRKLSRDGSIETVDLEKFSLINRIQESCPVSPVEAFVRVAIPDELEGTISYHTFPCVPQMTAGKLCRVIAHQFGVTNPEDHGLYLLVDGFETCLAPGDIPDVIRDQLRSASKNYMFAYKRHEAKIAWPKVAMLGTFNKHQLL